MPNPETPTPWYRQFWPWFLIALPTTVVVASVATIVIAIKNPQSLVSDHYYKDGLAINRTLALETRAREHGLHGRLRISDSGAVSLTLANASDIQALRLRWIHPTDGRRDLTRVATRQADGTFVAHAPVRIAQPFRIQLEPDTDRPRWRLHAEWSGKRPAELALAPGS